MHIVDSFNEVGNNFAISSRGIGEALFRSSSALAAANNTFEESIGMIVAANEVVQNPEVVGTALRTLSMRLRNSAGELQDMGEDAEDAAESITRLQQQLLELTDGRIDIMASATEFKSTFDILQDIANIWDTLTDVQQAEVTRLVAGVRQGQVMAALMQGMGSAASAAETALNSYGSAVRENEIWLRSLEGRIALFNATFESTASKMINSGFIKFFVDSGRILAEFFGLLDGWVGKAVALPVIIVTITNALRQLAATKMATGVKDTFHGWGQILTTLPAKLNDYGTAIQRISALNQEGTLDMNQFVLATEKLSSAQTARLALQQQQMIVDKTGISLTKASTAADVAALKAQVALQLSTTNLTGAKLDQTATIIANNAAKKAGVVSAKGLTVANTGMAISFKAVTTALNAMTIAMLKNPLFWGAAAIGAVMGVVNAHRAWNERIEENNRLLRDNARAARDELNTLEELIARYRELRTATVFDESSRSQVRDIQSQITDLVGEQAGNLDLVNGALHEQIGLLHTISREHAVAARDAAEAAMMISRNTADSTVASFVGDWQIRQDVVQAAIE